MKKQAKKLRNVMIWIFMFILLFSTITYAKPFTDAFRSGLIQINDFFAKEQYKPYATAIDFFFFALLFISIYMMGTRYAFKEVKKPEKVIAILLGLMTAFLLVLGGFSATILLPYIAWILYTLLFILYWWLLKGIKNKFWRFILALLLTLLTIGLIQGLFGTLSPDTEGFFSSLSKSFASIQFPETPGVPSYLSDLFGAPTTAPTGPDLTTLTPTTTPTAPAPEEKGFPWWAWVLIFLFGLPALGGLGYGGKKIWDWWRRGRPPTRPEELTVEQIIAKIDEIIRQKRDSITKINDTRDNKNRIIQAADQKIAVVSKLGELERANLWEGLRSITDQNDPLKRLFDVEMQFVTELKELKDVEKDLLNKFTEWQQFLSQRGNVGNDLAFLDNLIRERGNTKKIKEIGIVWLIKICYDFEKRVDILRQDQINLLEEENIEQLVRGKFETVKDNEKKLDVYVAAENKIIVALSEKIELQINILEELKRIVTEGRPAQPLAPEVPTVRPSIQITSPQNNTVLTLDVGEDQKVVTFEAQMGNLEISPQRQYNYQWVWINAEEGARDLLAGRLVASRTTRFRILKTSTATAVNIRDEIELPVGDHFIIIWLLGTNNRPIHVSNNYVKVTIQPPETPTTTPRVLRAPTPAAPVPLPSRMRINLMDAVKRERTLLKRISNSLKRIKEKIPIRGRREVEEAAVEAEEAAEELKEFEEKRILERISPALHEKSKRINRRVRAIVRFVKMKVKKEGFIKAAKILLKLEEDRVRALGTAEEGRPEITVPPTIISQPTPDVTAFFNDLFEAFRNERFDEVERKLVFGTINKILDNTQYAILDGVVTYIRTKQFDNAIRFLSTDIAKKPFSSNINIIEELKRVVEELRQKHI